MNTTSLFLIAIGALGLIVGSFLNVVIYRLPIMLKCSWREECLELLEQPADKPEPPFDLMRPRSHCPQCKKMISAWSNIPLVSYVVQKGTCRHCDFRIPLRYPIIELLSCLLAIIVAFHFGPHWQTTAGLLFTWAMLPLIAIDLDHQLLPDNITLGWLWLGLLFSLMGIFTNPVDAIIGAAVGYVSFWSVAWIFKRIRGIDGMGHGDFKLLAMIGAWFGWQALPAVIILSSLAGVIVGVSMILLKRHKLGKPMPFGPYLAVAGWLAMFWGTDMLHWYFRLSGLL